MDGCGLIVNFGSDLNFSPTKAGGGFLIRSGDVLLLNGERKHETSTRFTRSRMIPNTLRKECFLHSTMLNFLYNLQITRTSNCHVIEGFMVIASCLPLRRPADIMTSLVGNLPIFGEKNSQRMH